MEILDIATFLPYFESIRERTLRVVSLVPEDKLEWRHSPGVFSPGDLARHIAATERYVFAENVLGRPSRYSGCGTDLAQGKDGTLAFMRHMHAETVNLLRPLTPEDLQRKGTSPEGHPITAWKLLRAMVEHEIHHRGEIYVYLALLGVPRPPLYKLTEPELRALSSPAARVAS
ncbi:MAG TPA: DinB family protein [Methylomirabilota bacterium]|nr:DinB family protein [Methylomirabilota bacterium]